MADWQESIRRAFRSAGRQFAEAKRAYREGRAFDLPTDEDDRARIVCRRYAEKRTVSIDANGRPECFDADHPACRGCAEDVREGTVETW